jgi:exoribonuclease R
MVRRRLISTPQTAEGSPQSDEFKAALEALPAELEIQADYPADALAEAEAAIAAHHAGQGAPEWDARDLAFVTIDPASSTDLDQAVLFERAGTGYRVYYAIADVPSFVAIGGALDRTTRERGQTIYLPDRRLGLHPDSIAEDAGSLLPDKDRWAFVFTFELDERANVTRTELKRGVVRSRAKLSYAGVHDELASGSPSDFAVLLKEFGEKRIALEAERGGASLNLPEQEVSVDDEGHLQLVSRAPLDTENYNAQISLMTGMETARIFLEHNLGLIRTMPAPDESSLTEFRRRAQALGHPWPDGQNYGEFLRALDTSDPLQLALMHAAGSLFRGAGYLALPAPDGTSDDDLVQSAIGAPYTHTTAPLRRLVDRFVLVTAEALSQGRDVPADILAALPLLPELMKASDQKAGKIERASIDLVEAAVLQPRIGETFTAQVLTSDKGKATIQIAAPAVVARVTTHAAPGSTIRVTLTAVDIAKRTVTFDETSAAH